MTEDRMLRALSELDQPALPDSGFAERLLESLLAELDLRPAVAQSAIAGGSGSTVVPVHGITRAGGAQRSGRRTVGLLLAAAALLLLGVVGASLIIAGTSPKQETPLELMQRSREAYASAPAVRFVIKDGMGETTVSGDGRGSWRSTSWDQGPGSYSLYDGSRTGMYDALVRVWQVVPVENGGPPFPFNSEFAWTTISFPDLRATLEPVSCDDAAAAEPMTVAGREAVGIACRSIGMTYWVDPGTALVLRTAAEVGSPYWMGPEGRPSVREVTSFEVVDRVDPSQFAWEAPVAAPRSGAIGGTKLVVGEPPPAWEGVTLDGERVSLPGDGTPTAVLLTGSWCGSFWAGIAALDALGVLDAQGTPAGGQRVRRLVVSGDSAGTLAGYRSQHPFDVAMAADPDGALTTAWGIVSIPALVLLDGAGRVVDIVSGRPDDTDIAGTLEALVAGRPLPGPRVRPEPSPTPSAGAVCTDPETHVICLETGETLPASVGRTAVGAVVKQAIPPGRPSVLWIDSPAMCDGTCPDWVIATVKAVAAIERDYAGRAGLVLVASTEPEPGDTRALLEEDGLTIPVAYDWDGSLGRALGTLTNGVVVFDKDGRLVEQHPGPFDPDTVRAALDRLLEEAPS